MFKYLQILPIVVKSKNVIKNLNAMEQVLPSMTKHQNHRFKDQFASQTQWQVPNQKVSTNFVNNPHPNTGIF